MNTGAEGIETSWFGTGLTGATHDSVERDRPALLVKRSREGCHDAYRELVEQYRERIFRFCLGWTGNPEDAEELCQDVFIRAYSALPRYEGESRFEAWLYRIARNRCHDHHRSRNRRHAALHLSLTVDDNRQIVSPAPRPDEHVVDSEEISALRRAIASLPVRLREVLVLCAIEGLSQEACANLLGCSRRAVEGRLYRARLELAAMRPGSVP